MTKVISSLFTSGGTPILGLSPTIRIWEVDSGGDSLVVTNAAMTEVGDGFYKYNFTTYDPTKEYLFRTDGGATLPASERYQKASNRHGGQETWSVDIAGNNLSGSFGKAVNDININVNIAITVLDILLKYESNRTKVDPVANTLTIYDDDGVSILQVFDLFNDNGTPSSECVYERRPV